MVGRAVLNYAQGSTVLSWFFKGDEYVHVRWSPGSTKGQKIYFGPTKWTNGLGCLKETGFHKIDSILSLPQNIYLRHYHEAYFFCDDKYALVELYPNGFFPWVSEIPRSSDSESGGSDDSSDDDPGRGAILPAWFEVKEGSFPRTAPKLLSTGNISDIWPSLAKAGFNRIDGAVMNPHRSNEAYVFNRTQYCHIRFTWGGGRDEILDGPNAIEGCWAGMDFAEIEAIIPCPRWKRTAHVRKAYVFCEDQYAQIRFHASESSSDTKKTGRRDIVEEWPCLKQAGFY
ncbi:hemopexin domain protein [Ceratobasidium sp. AG-Ba]|nr:hemopexin domain protein [Ceratobasidium sp. AG-Ba]